MVALYKTAISRQVRLGNTSLTKKADLCFTCEATDEISNQKMFCKIVNLDCFHVPAVVNTAAMNTGVHMSPSILVSSGCMPSSGIAGS